MNAVLKKAKTKVQVVDLFSGCGGMSLGFLRAKTKNLEYRIAGAIDIDRYANSTYARNIGLLPIETDIRNLLKGEGLEEATRRWQINRKEPFLLIGCAPCQGFSSHGKRYVGTDQRNSLVRTFAELVIQLKPDLVVMENVPEMLHKANWMHYAHWVSRLTNAGYTVRCQVYNMAQFGVPQERFRALVLASKNWSQFRMPSPLFVPTRFKTVRDAIAHLPPLRAGEQDVKDPMHVTSHHRRETVELLKLVPADGGSQADLPSNVGPDCIRNVDGFRDVYGRMFWDRPANAITTRCRTPSAGRYAHPEQHRGLSVREAGLLQGFPSDFMFEGPFDDKFKQIGNAVSPPFSKAIAEHIDGEWIQSHTAAVDCEGDIRSPILKSISSSLASLKKKMRKNPDMPLGALLRA